MKTLYLLLGVTLSVLISCKKESVPSPPPTVLAGTDIRISYHPNNTDVKSVELIISDTNGKVLLDTIGPVDTQIAATLKSNEHLFDVSFVHLDEHALTYTVNTFRQVDPSKWTTVTNILSYFSPIFGPPNTPANLHFTNAPSGPAYFINSSYPAGAVINQGQSFIDVSYSRFSGNYSYLLMPASRLYQFYMPQTDHDTVDLSKMDTATAINYTKPAGYNLSYSNLEGFMDTTDFTRYLWLYYNPLIYSGDDMIYPKKMVQKYEFSIGFMNANKEFNNFYNYGYTVPNSLSFLDNSYYSIQASQKDNFSVQFLKNIPTYYMTQWTTGNITWNLYTSPDLASQQPLTFLIEKHSQLLNGQDLSALALNQFSFFYGEDYGYNDYFNYMFTPALLSKKLFKSAVSYSKNF